MAEHDRIEIYRGDDNDLYFDGVANGSVAGWTVEFTMRQSAWAPDPPVLTVTGTVEDVGSVSTPGVFKVRIAKSQSVVLQTRLYDYQLARTDVGAEQVIADGKAMVKPALRYALS